MFSNIKKISTIIFVLLSISSPGQEWKKSDPVFEKPGTYDMSLGIFVDEKNGWFTEGFPGRIWRTRDGGNYWEMQKDSTAVWTYSIVFTDTIHGWISGKRISDYKPFI